MLDEEALVQLDKIFEFAWERHRTESDAKIDEDVTARVQQLIDDGRVSPIDEKAKKGEAAVIRKQLQAERARSEGKELRIYYPDGFLPASSFAAAQDVRDVVERRPVGFDRRLKSPSISIDVRLRGDRSDTLSIALSPTGESLTDGVYTRLKAWAVRNSPSIWIRCLAGVHHFQWGVLVAMVPLLWLVALRQSDDPARSELNDRAGAVLQDGLTDEEVPEAISIVLSRDVLDSSARLPAWFWGVLFGAVSVCAAMEWVPKTQLGIGAGKKAITHSRMVLRWLWYTVPSFVFGELVIIFLWWVFGSN